MTIPAPTLYESFRASQSARLEPTAPVAEPTPVGHWAAFLAAFDSLLDAFRSGDAARLEHARQDVAGLRAQLAAGGVALPSATRRVQPERPARRLVVTVDR